jgi:hypothetical protein
MIKKCAVLNVEIAKKNVINAYSSITRPASTFKGSMIINQAIYKTINYSHSAVLDKNGYH